MGRREELGGKPVGRFVPLSPAEMTFPRKVGAPDIILATSDNEVLIEANGAG